MYADINSAKLYKIIDVSNTFNAKPAIDLGASGTLSSNAMEEEKSGRPLALTSTGSKTSISTFTDIKTHRPHTTASNSKLLQTSQLKKNMSSKNLSSEVSEPVDTSSTLSAEDAEIKLAELGLPETVIKGLNESDWKCKKSAIIEFSNWIEENSKLVSNYSEHIIRVMKAKLKDWKESNMNLIKEALQFFLSLSKNKDITFTKKSFSLLSNFIVNCIPDTKYNDLCCSIVLSYLEVVSPKFIITNFINCVLDPKNPKSANPKTLSESAALLVKILDQVTIKFFPLKESIDFCKLMLSNSNPSVRTSSTNLLKDFYRQLGAPINDFLNDVNPNILKTLQTEFQQIVPVKNLNIKIEFRGEAETEVSHDISSNPLDSLPRADISKESEKLLKKLSDGDWKIRKEGLDALEQLLISSNNRILPNGLHDLVGALKVRLSDPNKSLVRGFIAFVGKFATALGPNTKIFTKVLLPSLINTLSDKQILVRQDANITLDKFSAEIGSDSIINCALPLLVQESPELRIEIINWILKKSDALPKSDIKANITAILTSLQDKTKEIRNLTERLLEKCTQIVTIVPFINALKDLKPAIQQNLKPMIEKYKTSDIKILSDEIEVEQPEQTPIIEGVKLIKKAPLNDNRTNSNMRHQRNPTSVNNQLLPASTSGVIQSAQSISRNSIQASPKGLERGLSLKTSSLNNQNVSLNDSNSGKGTPIYELITITNQKEKRIDEERKLKWPLDELNDELVDRLKEYLKRALATDCYIKLFSVDSKKNIESINMLKKAATSDIHGTVDILDLMFRWIFMRLWENSNPIILKEILDYLHSVINSLELLKYKMLEFEACVLIPCLVEKLENITLGQKEIMMKIFSKLCLIYPQQKIIITLVNGLNSQSQKAKTEAMEMIAFLVEVYGIDIVSQHHIKLFVKLLSNQDPIIINASLNVLTEIYKHIGETLLITIYEAGFKEVDIIRQKAKGGKAVIIQKNIGDMVIKPLINSNPSQIISQSTTLSQTSEGKTTGSITNNDPVKTITRTMAKSNSQVIIARAVDKSKKISEDNLRIDSSIQHENQASNHVESKDSNGDDEINTINTSDANLVEHVKLFA